VVFLFACSGGLSSEAPAVEVDIEITDSDFAAIVDGILADFASFEGQTVRLEGVFQEFGQEIIYRSVLRRAGTC